MRCQIDLELNKKKKGKKKKKGNNSNKIVLKVAMTLDLLWEQDQALVIMLNVTDAETVELRVEIIQEKHI